MKLLRVKTWIRNNEYIKHYQGLQFPGKAEIRLASCPSQAFSSLSIEDPPRQGELKGCLVVLVTVCGASLPSAAAARR